MSVNIAQVVATCSGIATVLIPAGGVTAWLLRRRTRRSAATQALADAIIEAKIGKITNAAITAATDAILVEVADLQKRSEEDRVAMATQFGGNSGGIREAVNKISAAQANLDGRFTQYVNDGK